MADLFEVEELRKLLRLPPADFDTDAATLARRLASGWLADATGLTVWPTPVPEQLWSWAIELGAIAYNNPEAAESEQVDDYRVYNDKQRRGQILDDARRAYAVATTGPQGSFPDWDWSWDSATPRKV